VFISFRGSDTRNTFVDHLYSHLIRKGIFTFKDDKQLQKGESISPQLLQAIQHSRVSIIVFSKDYASSTWCLDEMVAIANCRADLKQIVFPVFYDVDPSHVRQQNGVYESAFVLHTEKFKDDPHKVNGWKSAMTCFAGLSGWDVMNK
jgi:ABC-type phosphate transport system substrate-binding protein